MSKLLALSVMTHQPSNEETTAEKTRVSSSAFKMILETSYTIYHMHCVALDEEF